MSNNIFASSNGSVQAHQQPSKASSSNGQNVKTGTASRANANGGDAEGASEAGSDADEDGDHSHSEDKEALKKEADVQALPGATAPTSTNALERLAGSIHADQAEKEGAAVDANDMDLVDDHALARRLSLTSDSSEHDDFNFDMDADPYQGLSFLDDDYKDMAGRAELSLWRMPDNVRNREDSAQSGANQKRVRFEDDIDTRSMRSSSLSSCDEDEDEEEDPAFPDLFMSQDDPLLLQRLALDREDIDDAFHPVDNSDAGSVWDWDGADEQLAFKIIDEDESESDDDSEADSEDDSDDDDEDGDKTDEECEEDQIARMEQMKKARASFISNESAKGSMPPPARTTNVSSTKALPTARPSTPVVGKLPRTGTFVLDPTRASMQASGNKVTTRPPSAPLERERDFWQRHTSAANSRQSSPRSSFSVSTPTREDFPSRPFTTQSTLRTMFGGNLQYLPNNDIPEVAGDFDLISTAPPMTIQSSFTSTSMNDDSDADAEDINMEDFMHVDDSSSDDEIDCPPSSAITSPGERSLYSGFNASSPAQRHQGANDDLLAHLDRSRGVVGSFRRNQQNARVVGSMASHPAVRASTSEMNALQKGRRAAANTPMTPARKKRGTSQDMTLTGSGVRKSMAASVGSPLINKSPTRRRGQSIHSTFSPRRY